MIRNTNIVNEEVSEEEVKVYTVAVGNLPIIKFFMTRACREAIEIIRGQEGFIGLAPCRPHGTLCLFKTLNDAKSARNIMRMEGIECGDNICEVYINRKFVDG